jgi:ATP-dependent RNA helicase RhlE
MNKDNVKDFHGLGIAPAILGVLQRLKFTSPTPIQEQSIPVGIEGKDLMGIAQTGTGKTLAFGIPLIQAMLQERGVGLVIAPTRELALQIDETIQKVGAPLGIRTAIMIGGEPMFRQIKRLARDPHILIGTPGRIIDHLEQKTLSLKKVSILVLDEADRMLDMGFAPQLKKIMAVVPEERQTMLFSATMPEEIVAIARAYLKTPLRVEIARPGTAATNVTQEVFFVHQESKMPLLEKILYDYKGSVLVFARMKYGAKKIAARIRFLGHTAAELHSNRSLSQRKEALEGFKYGKYRILVATDIAARGIDVTNIELVVNFDLPSVAEDYVHRIGRTGRAGGSGHAISFARPNERRDVEAIERLMRKVLPISRVPEGLPKAEPEAERPPRSNSRGFGSRPPRPGFGNRGGTRGHFRSSGGSRGGFRGRR